MTIDHRPPPSDPLLRPSRNNTAATVGHDHGERVAAMRDRPDRTVPSRWKRQANQWMRWTHVYVSMFALLVILFFGLTGLTLNHPDWTFGDDVQQDTIAGTLPDSVIVDDRLELLVVSEFLRDEHNIGGDVTSFDTSATNGSISYRGPGYGADVVFDSETLDYTVTVQQEGFIAVMNDLHRGSDTGSAWKWAIDISAGALVLVAVTGLAIQFLMRKRRTRALIVSGTGAVVGLLLMWIATA